MVSPIFMPLSAQYRLSSALRSASIWNVVMTLRTVSPSPRPVLSCTSMFERRSHLFRYRHAHRHPAGSLRDGGPFHGAAFGPGGPFENPLGERADDDGGDDHTDGSPKARDEVRLRMVGPEPGDQREDQRQAGGKGGELVEHEGERADGMRDQSHRQRDDDEQGDEAGGDDGDAQIYREHIESEHDRPSFSLLFRFFGHVGVVDGDARRLEQHGGLAHGGGMPLHGRLGPDPVGQVVGQVGDA